jgi:hypothetical protein
VGAALPDAALAPTASAQSAGKHLVVDIDGLRHRLWLPASDTDDSLIIVLAPSRNPLRIAAADCARALLAADRSPLAIILSPSAFRRHRLALLLAIIDAALAGASARAIGHRIVFPPTAGQSAAAWKASNERRHVQRLIAEAKAMMVGGYRALLAGDHAYFAQG